MDLTQIFIAVLGIVCAVIGWFCRQLWDAAQQLRKDLGVLEVRIATDYITYDRLQDRLQESLKPVLDSLNEIKQTLTHKADK